MSPFCYRDPQYDEHCQHFCHRSKRSLYSQSYAFEHNLFATSEASYRLTVPSTLYLLLYTHQLLIAFFCLEDGTRSHVLLLTNACISSSMASIHHPSRILGCFGEPIWFSNSCHLHHDAKWYANVLMVTEPHDQFLLPSWLVKFLVCQIKGLLNSWYPHDRYTKLVVNWSGRAFQIVINEGFL